MKLACRDINQIPSIETIEKLAKDGKNVVLKFPKDIVGKKKSQTIVFIKGLLPEYYSVFDSGGDKEGEWVTILPVIKQHEIDKVEAPIRESFGNYITLCNELMYKFENDLNLSKKWKFYRHGGHIRFQNKHTDQIIEAPISGISQIKDIDPYFWGIYIESTDRYKMINDLLEHKFHDSSKILDYLMAKDSGSIKKSSNKN